MNAQQLSNLFQDFNNKTIAIIGDVMIDSYLWGKADRISPEAPVPVVSVTKRESRPGGAANVAINVKALGANPILIAIVGNDIRGDEFIDIINNYDITHKGILRSENRKTTVKHRIISSNQHLLRIDDEESDYIDNKIENKFVNHCIETIKQYKPDAIIFEDYDKGNITPTLIKKIVEHANINNIPTLVDPKKRNFGFYKNVTLFKPNFKELTEGMKVENITSGNPTEIAKTATQLLKTLGAEYIMTTLSEHGILITSGKQHFYMPAQKREIADVSGAGDTVISVTALALACKITPDNIATIANIAGGQVCEKPGVVPVDKTTLLKECIEYYNKK